MTVINHKSISGVTSITAPAGSDNLFTVHTNDTTERFRIDASGHQNISGIITASNFKTGTTNVHNVGVEAAGINVLGADTPIGTGATIYDAGGAVFTGVVTSTSFIGENSSGAANLTLKTTSNSFNSLILDSNRAADTQFAIIDGRWNGNVVNRIQFVSGSDGTNKDDGYMAFHTRTSGASLAERLRIDSDGHLGVGDDNPNYRLSVKAASGTDVVGKFTSTDAKAWIQFRDNSTTDTGVMIGAEGDDLMLRAGSNERLRISADGQLIHKTNKASGYIAEFHQEHADNPGTLLIDSPTNNNIRPSALHLSQAGTVKWVIGQVYNSTSDRALHICSGTGQSNSKLVVTTAGNIGISEVSPDNKLHVTTTNSTAYSTNTNNTQNLTNALLKLENLDGTDNSGVNNYVGIQFSIANGANSTAQLNYVRTGNNAGAFQFKARNAASTYPNLMTIKSDGKIGIGITNPNAMMQIISDQNAETNRFNSSNYHLMLQNTGNDTGEAVGLGFAISDDIDKVGGAILFERSGGGSAGDLQFYTNSDGASVTERLRITSDGIIETGTAVGASGADGDQRLRVGRASNCNIAIRATGSTTAYTGLDFGDSADDRAGRIQYMHNGDYMSFHTNGAGSGADNERLRITSTGVLSLNDSTPETWATLQVNNHSTHNAAQVLIRGADQAQIILRDDTGGSNQKCTTIRNDGGVLIFGTHNDAFSAFTERYRITTAGTHVFGGNTAAPIVDNGELLYRGNSTQTFESLPQSFYLYGDSLGSGSANAGTGLVLGGKYKTDGSITTFAGIHGIKENTTNDEYGGALVFGVRQNGSSSWERMRITSGGQTRMNPPAANGSSSLISEKQALIGTKHFYTVFHTFSGGAGSVNSPLAVNSKIPTNTCGTVEIMAGWANGNGLRYQKYSWIASGATSITQRFNDFNSRYGVSVSVSTPTMSISGDWVNWSFAFSDGQGSKMENLKIHFEYFHQFRVDG